MRLPIVRSTSVGDHVVRSVVHLTNQHVISFATRRFRRDCREGRPSRVGRKRESTCIVAPLTAKGKLALQAGNHNQYKLIRQLGYLMTAPDPKQRTVELEECVNQWPGHPDHILIEKERL